MLNEEVARALDEPYEKERLVGASQERKAVIAWLRSVGGEAVDPGLQHLFRHLADCIENGDHHGPPREV